MTKVLIVEDDDVIAQGMAAHLAGEGFDPIVVGRGEQGLARGTRARMSASST
jgi:DNA-binding response OmpR family regulator